VSWRYVGDGVVAYRTNWRPRYPWKILAWKKFEKNNQDWQSGTNSGGGGNVIPFRGGISREDGERIAAYVGWSAAGALLTWYMVGRNRAMAK
jgi:hypothetical protein